MKKSLVVLSLALLYCAPTVRADGQLGDAHGEVSGLDNVVKADPGIRPVKPPILPPNRSAALKRKALSSSHR